MPRVCTICAHAERAAIDAALVGDATFRNIAERFFVSIGSLTRHKADHLPGTLVQAMKVQREDEAIDTMAELQACFGRVKKLMDACDLWLSDPNDPTVYTLEPRASEVKVIYTEPGPKGKPIQRKERLSVLLDRLEGKMVLYTEVRHSDPRELILKTAGQMQSNLELLGELLGELNRNPTINLLIAPEWIAVRSQLMAALADYPEARASVALALREAVYEHD
jgi:hypothetical protein